MKNKIIVLGMSDNFAGLESFIMNYYKKLHNYGVVFDFLTCSKHIVFEDELYKLNSSIYRYTPCSNNILKYYSDLNDFFRSHAYEYDIAWANQCDLANLFFFKIS